MKLMKVTLLIMMLLMVSGAYSQSPDSFIIVDSYGLPGNEVDVSIYMRNTQFSVAGFSMKFALRESTYTSFVAVSRGSAVEDFEYFGAILNVGMCRVSGIADLPYNGTYTPPLPLGYHEMVRITVAIDDNAPIGALDSIIFVSDTLPPDRDNSIADSTGYINEEPTLINGAVFFNTQTSIDDGVLELPMKPRLFQNYPNPFNAETRISFLIADESSGVKLDIFDVMGREVKSYFWDYLFAGEHYVVWDGRNKSGESITSGIYFYRLVLSGSIVDRRSMTLLK